jgi:hypothetical protein
MILEQKESKGEHYLSPFFSAQVLIPFCLGSTLVAFLSIYKQENGWS